MELASGLVGQWGERWVNHTRLSDSQGSLSEAALQPRMLTPPPCAAEQLLWPKSSDWGPSAEAITLACVGCHWAIKHGHTASMASRQARVSSRNHSREGGTGWMPSTAVHSGPLGHPLACTSQAHPCLHTHRGLSHQLPKRLSDTHLCAASHSSHTHTLCPSHSELTHPEVPPQGYPHSCSGIIIGVPRRLTRLGA